jgi:hypothetical protein
VAYQDNLEKVLDSWGMLDEAANKLAELDEHAGECQEIIDRLTELAMTILELKKDWRVHDNAIKAGLLTEAGEGAVEPKSQQPEPDGVCEMVVVEEESTDAYVAAAMESGFGERLDPGPRFNNVFRKKWEDDTKITDSHVAQLVHILNQVVQQKSDGNCEMLQEMSKDGCISADKVKSLIMSALDYMLYGN